jgi:outer membrane protein TolC
MMLSLLFCLSALSAPLTLPEVLSKTAQRLPLILEAEQKIKAARAELQGAQGAFDHRLKLETMNQFEEKYDNQFWDARLERQTRTLGSRLYLGQRQGTGLFPVYEGKYESSSAGEFYAGLEVPLLRDRAMDEARLQEARAGQNLASSKAQYRQKTLELLGKAGAVYWKWVAAGQKLAIIEDWTRIAEERQELIAKRVAAGDMGNIVLTDNRRSLAKRKAELTKAQRDFESAAMELSLYLGTDSVARERLPKEIPLSPEKTAPPSETERRGLPLFELLSIERRLLEQEELFAKSLRQPDLRLNLEGVRDLGQLPPSQTDPDQLRVGVRLEIPFENNKGLGKLNEVSAKVKALKERSRWIENEWRTRLSQNAVALRTTREQLTLLTQETSDAQKMSQAELRRMRAGDSDVFFLNVREQDEADARIRLLETQALHEMMVLERQALDGDLLSYLTSAKESP